MNLPEEGRVDPMDRISKEEDKLGAPLPVERPHEHGELKIRVWQHGLLGCLE